MDRMGTRRAAVLVVPLLLLAAACGDDGGAESSAGGTGGDGGDSGEPLESLESLDSERLCSLLDEAEIAAEFGEQGSVAEGRPDSVGCHWDVGSTVNAIGLTSYASSFGPVDEQTFEFDRESAADRPEVEVVDAPGVADAAYFELTPTATITLHFLSGEVSLNLFASFSPEIEGTQDKMIVLAGHVVDRL